MNHDNPSLPTLLVVDDEASMRRSILRALDEEQCNVLEAASAQEAIAILEKRKVHVLVSDHDMPGMCGLDLLRMVRLRWPSVQRIMVTAANDFTVAVRAINLGEVSRFICKPWQEEELICSVRQAFEQAALDLEVKKLRAHARKTRDVLRTLEREHPGITTLRRDDGGAILLDEGITDEGGLAPEALWSEVTS
jgi:DNA-binding NtrC family response regulator